VLSNILLFMFPALLLLAAAYDIGQYRIPNWLCASVAAVFVPVAIASGMPWATIGMSLLLGLCVLIVSMVLFAFKVVGGGDAKLLAAASLWMGWHAMLPFVVVVGIIGGFIALMLLFFRRVPLPAVMVGHEWITRLHSNEQGIPYGVALAAAGILIYRQTPVFVHLVG
jgi:prepilin peptidase CpaA